MSPGIENKLAHAVQSGQLTTEQEKQLDDYLEAHPSERLFWEEELGLNQVLQQMADTPVSSNFTARLLDAVREEAAQGDATGGVRGWSWFSRWLPKVAMATAVVALSLFSLHQHRAAARHDLAEHLSQMAKLAPETPLELLENFDVINRLNQVPRDSDRELIAALQ